MSLTRDEIIAILDVPAVKAAFERAVANNSELELLEILKRSSFLFYELFLRKFGIQPVFHEINFGGALRCDFAWLNDNSDGPEWTLVEIERPGMALFRRNGDPTHELNHAIEQVKSWRRYFNEHHGERRRIFGAVGRFRYILVGGTGASWAEANAAKWRIDHNKETEIEIRSIDVFSRAIELAERHPDEFWSFAENPVTLPPGELANYWGNDGYINRWRRLIN